MTVLHHDLKRRASRFMRWELKATSFVSFLALATPALAQEASSQPAPSQPAPAPEDGAIVVTALRRATTVQDTPLAITAITGDALTKSGTTSITDIVKMAPGLRIQDSGPGQRRISLRGILSAGEPTVGLYYDETPVAGNVGISSDAGGRTPDFSLFDVDRIEVLRGPQGTLYGASSMGGTIRVVMNKPKFDYEGAVDGTVSSTKDGGLGYNVNGMVNLPIVHDLLAARLVVYRRHSDGYIDNVRLGRDDVNPSSTNGGRLQLRLTPASGLTIDGSAMVENTDAFSNSWNPDLGRYKIQNYIELPYRDRSQIYNVTGRWDTGPVTVTAVTSYQHRAVTYTSADDSFTVLTQRTAAGCARIFNGGRTCTADQFAGGFTDYLNSLIPVAFQTPGTTRDRTHELRFSSNGDHWLNWTAGAFFEDRKNHVDSTDYGADPATGFVKTPAVIYYHRYVNDHYKQQAGFGEVSVKPLAKLTLTAGGRYYHYDREITGATDVPWVVIGAGVRAPYLVQTRESGWLFKFNGEYRFDRDLMAYAQVSKGARPGGANQTIGLPTSLVPYGSDTVTNYELGAKAALFGRRLTVDAAVFQLDWDNMQVSGKTPDGIYTYITNVGASRVRGAELEVSAHPARNLNLFANMTYLDAKLTQDQVNDFIVGAGRKGDRIPYIPHLAVGVGAEYRHPVSSGIDVYGRIDANYVGASYSEFRPTNPFRLKIDDYALANIRLGVEAPDGVWGAYLFVNNVFNSVAINQATQNALINSHVVTSAMPRTVGLNVRYRF